MHPQLKNVEPTTDQQCQNTTLEGVHIIPSSSLGHSDSESLLRPNKNSARSQPILAPLGQAQRRQVLCAICGPVVRTDLVLIWSNQGDERVPSPVLPWLNVNTHFRYWETSEQKAQVQSLDLPGLKFTVLPKHNCLQGQG